MSQNAIDFPSSDPSGNNLLDDLLDGFQEDVLTNNSGTSRPSYAKVGTLWLDTTTNPWVVKVFNGTDDIIFGYLNTSTLIFTSVDDKVATTASSGTVTLDLSANRIFKTSVTNNVTYAFSNPTATGSRCAFEVHLFQDGTGRTITWPGTVKWSNGTAPVINTASKNYMISFYTIDGGTTYVGTLSDEAFA